MDVMLLSFLIMFIMFWKSFRIFIAYTIFFLSRLLMQNIFFVGRPDGFLWSNPGIFSVAVPYPDINDFFWSGHVGTCFLLVLEYRACGWHKLSKCCLGVLIMQWVMMMVVRTHYIMDLMAGLIFSHYIFMIGEYLSYFTDVKCFGILNERGREFYKPCHFCGNPNKCAVDRMHLKEKI